MSDEIANEESAKHLEEALQGLAEIVKDLEQQLRSTPAGDPAVDRFRQNCKRLRSRSHDLASRTKDLLSEADELMSRTDALMTEANQLTNEIKDLVSEWEALTSKTM